MADEPWPITPAQMPQPAYMTVQEAAHMFDVADNTMYDLCNRGIVPSIKLGAARRIPRLQFARWIEEHMTGTEETG